MPRLISALLSFRLKKTFSLTLYLSYLSNGNYNIVIMKFLQVYCFPDSTFDCIVSLVFGGSFVDVETIRSDYEDIISLRLRRQMFYWYRIYKEILSEED